MIKRLLKSGLRRFGVEVSRTDASSRPGPKNPSATNGELLAYHKLGESQRIQYREIHKPYPIYSPWSHDRDFLDLFEAVRPSTLLSPDRCWVLYSLAKQQARQPADFAECGVYRGGSALLLATLKRREGRPDLVHLFDSFAGLPTGEKELDPYWEAGTFKDTSLEAVKRRLIGFEDLCAFYPGWIPSTFSPGVAERQFCLVHLDLDLYRPTLDSCRFFWPRMIRGGVMIVDDYGFPSSAGVKVAVDEFQRVEDMIALYVPTGQFVAMKR